jgi:phosphoribosylamine--glycine ligase
LAAAGAIAAGLRGLRRSGVPYDRLVRVLLLGSGGREHALATALAADPSVSVLVCAPGNPGMGALAALVPVDVTDVAAVAALAVETAADLVVIGPEQPLVAGAADAIRAKGIACFGPSGAAAALEGSKAFAKEIMAGAGVPTARSRICVDGAEVAAALDEFGAPYVVKDDGLAAGKGVVVTYDRQAAADHAAACGRVVVEEYLAGPEVSLFVVTDGEAALPLLPAQDFKRVGDGDTGPNTGGMGAYAPLPWAPDGLVDDVMAAVVHPTLAAMRERGTPFVGLLYVGLAITADGPKVIEFNCRFGDPETQVVLALLETPLAGLLLAAATGRLAAHPPLRWRTGSAVTVVVAAENYPGTPRRGDLVTGADGVPGVIHAGTARRDDGALVSAGGRVLCCTATGEDLAAARAAAYALVDGVGLAGSHHRHDIALAAARGEITVPLA